MHAHMPHPPAGLNKHSESMGTINFTSQMMSSSFPHHSSRVNALESLGLILSFTFPVAAFPPQ